MAVDDRPGFRFNPTDEELIIDYLLKKNRGEQPPTNAVQDGEVNGDNAQILNDIGDRVTYRFAKVKKSKNGRRTNRKTVSGKWKVWNGAMEIYDNGNRIIGNKTSLTFFGRKIRLNIDEYKLDGQWAIQSSEEWVLWRIKHRNTKKPNSNREEEEEDSLPNQYFSQMDGTSTSVAPEYPNEWLWEDICNLMDSDELERIINEYYKD